jgi:hypothetical protein
MKKIYLIISLVFSFSKMGVASDTPANEKRKWGVVTVGCRAQPDSRTHSNRTPVFTAFYYTVGKDGRYYRPDGTLMMGGSPSKGMSVKEDQEGWLYIEAKNKCSEARGDPEIGAALLKYYEDKKYGPDFLSEIPFFDGSRAK